MSTSSEHSAWISVFCSEERNKFFCEVDKDYIENDFNLTGFDKQVPRFEQALDTLLDEGDVIVDDSLSDEIEQSAEMLYGLIHARYILTVAGISKMISKFVEGEFGYCLRIDCNSQPMLPIGLFDLPGEESVKCYCPKCMEIYTPYCSKVHHTDGAYFGTSFPHKLFMDNPECRPQQSINQSATDSFYSKIRPEAVQLEQLRASTSKEQPEDL